ncbi:MAG: hypothetical protein QNJ53_11570 [Pleurocapsa sp. MO_192.B19]|nr:hypothetical protein [Pleurocapsa sp. MO_192.B19]
MNVACSSVENVYDPPLNVYDPPLLEYEKSIQTKLPLDRTKQKLLTDYLDGIPGIDRVREIIEEVTKDGINYRLKGVCEEIKKELDSNFVAIQWINQENVIEAVAGVDWVGLSRHYAKESDPNLRDIQADIVQTFNTEIIAGYDPRFDQGIYQEKQFRHASMVRIFTPILISKNSGDSFNSLNPQVHEKPWMVLPNLPCKTN